MTIPIVIYKRYMCVFSKQALIENLYLGFCYMCFKAIKISTLAFVWDFHVGVQVEHKYLNQQVNTVSFHI